MSVRLHGNTGLIDALGHMKRARVRIALVAIDVVEGAAKQEAPVKTGALRTEIEGTPDSGSTSGKVESGQELNYPPIVHDGSRFRTGNPYMDRALRRAPIQVEHEAIAILKQELGV